MTNMTTRFATPIRLLANSLQWLAGFTTFLMMIHVMLDVLGKYLLSMPVPSTAEVVANYYMISCVFLSLAFIEARGTAISVDLIYDNVGESWKAVMRTVGQVVTFAFYSGLAWFSWDVAMRAYRIDETVDGLWRITVWPAKFLLPLGLALSCLVLLLKIFGGRRMQLSEPPAQNDFEV